VKIRPNKVTPTIPKAHCRAHRLPHFAPGPTAIARESLPKMKAKLVIRIGRRRDLAACTAASNLFMP
jgi:hypothetical protein